MAMHGNGRITVDQPSARPTAKMEAAGAAGTGAAALLLIWNGWLAPGAGLPEMPEEVAPFVVAAAAFVAGYLKPERATTHGSGL